MGKALIIAKKDIKEALHGKSTYLYVILLCLLTLPYFDGLRNILGNLSKQGVVSAEMRFAGQSFVNIVACTLPLVLTMLICGVFSAYSIIMDKAKRTIESLLATPLSLRQIWLGKSLAVTLPSITIALLVSFLALIAMNLTIIVPTIGNFILPSAVSLVTALVLVPLMTFFVVEIVSFLQLTTANPRIANFAFTGIFLGIFMSTITEVTASWDFRLIYLAASLLLAAVTLFLARFLTKERVILSSKG